MTTTAPTQAPTATAVERRVARLRELAQQDPGAAQEETWAWFVEAGRRVQGDREAALRELGELFRAGTPGRPDGPTRGTLVGFTLQPVFDRIVAAITTLWLPWAGKQFHADERGDNLLVRSAKWPAKLLWPRYAMRDAAEKLVAFDFQTWVEPGKVDPDVEVLVIDYDSVDSNPGLIIKKIRDELVEVVPGTHLGKMLWRQGQEPDARYTLLAYFALRTPVA